MSDLHWKRREEFPGLSILFAIVKEALAMDMVRPYFSMYNAFLDEK